MNIFILRHAKAEARNAKYKPDGKRPLSPEGVEIMQEVAKGMLALGITFDLILTSPYARALKTAEITAAAYGTDKVWITQNLTSEGSPKKFIEEINDNYSALKNILIVGHNPGLPELISMLLTGTTDLEVNLKKSGLCKLTADDLHFGRCATLEWVLTPRQLQKLGKNGSKAKG